MIRVPGLDGEALSDFVKANSGAGGSIFSLYSMFTGGALSQCAVGALGIMPYISATIIIQLMTAVVPQLSKLAREEGGRTKIIQYGRYLAVILCIVQGAMTTFTWENPSNIFNGFTGQLVMWDNIWMYRITTIIILTAGTMLLMWLGEQITERGIGNGISLIITVGIMADLPKAAFGLKDLLFSTGSEAGKSGFNPATAILLVVLLFVVIAAVVAVTQAQRKIPVQYAQRAVGRKVFAGGTSFMPLKVNYAGVMPIIFAQAILMIPASLFDQLSKHLKDGTLRSVFVWLASNLNQDSSAYIILYSLMILFFSYFWVATQFNELQIADDLKKNGGYIPGVRPGTATSDYLHHAMTRITLAGAVFLCIIAVIPSLLYRAMDVNMTVGQFFGGTSMLITVGVMLDTMRQIESHLLMRHYDGFLKKGRVKGRF